MLSESDLNSSMKGVVVNFTDDYGKPKSGVVVDFTPSYFFVRPREDRSCVVVHPMKAWVIDGSEDTNRLSD